MSKPNLAMSIKLVQDKIRFHKHTAVYLSHARFSRVLRLFPSVREAFRILLSFDMNSLPSKPTPKSLTLHRSMEYWLRKQVRTITRHPAYRAWQWFTTIRRSMKSPTRKPLHVTNEKWPEHLPLVSVIVPCYNYGQYLEEAIDSVLAQKLERFEIIVVNDGSTDPHTKEVLKNLNKPKTTIINQQNVGLPGARNAGIEGAQGKYICCLDADDKLHPDYLYECVKKMQREGLDVCSSYVQEFGESNRLLKPGKFEFQQLIFSNTFVVSSVFTKEMWKKVGGYDPQMKYGYEDWDLWINIAKHGGTGGVVAKPLFFYRKRLGTMTAVSEEKHFDTYTIMRHKYK